VLYILLTIPFRTNIASTVPTPLLMPNCASDIQVISLVLI